MTKKIFQNLLVLVTLISMIGAFGCSSDTSNPATPDILSNSNPTGSHDVAGADTNGVLGVYDIMIDPDTMTASLVEARSAQTHYDITAYIAPSAVINLISYNPLIQELQVDVQITNPSSLDVYDLRGLLLASPGSGYGLRNADDYTHLFNPYVTPIPNPFKAYAKTVTDRKFAAGATHTEFFDIELPPGFIPPLLCQLLVECSYPDNCNEPFEIANQTISNDITSTLSAAIQMQVFDHQNNVGAVEIDTTPITGGITTLINSGPDTWTGSVINSAGAAPGIYHCLIEGDSWSGGYLYDYIDIQVDPEITVGGSWTGTEYPVKGTGCSLDLGVIADPGGPRDSQILMIGDDVANCDAILKYPHHYSGAPTTYAKVTDASADIDAYSPFPVDRLDAADDGAFSFTNKNWIDLYPAGLWMYYAQVWTCYDRTPALHTGPAPDDSRYYFDFMANYDTQMRPVDVCDDFALGQYALFSSTYSWSPQDLMLVGTMPNSYTHDKVKFMADLDSWAGIGDGLVDPDGILGIDVIEFDDDLDESKVLLYVLETNTGSPQVEVFEIYNSAAGWGYDAVGHLMTIDVAYNVTSTPTHMEIADARDIEILPANNDYELNPSDPTLCVLQSWGGNGEVNLYNASTGVFLESIGTLVNPALQSEMVEYLDTDDGDWEIHVSLYSATGGVAVKVFDY